MKLLKNPHTWTLLRSISKELMLDGFDERISTLIPAVLAFNNDESRINEILRLNGFSAKVEENEIERVKEWIDANEELSKFLKMSISASESFSDFPKIGEEEFYFLGYLISREIFICFPRKELNLYSKILDLLKEREVIVHIFSDLKKDELEELSKTLRKIEVEYTIYPATTPLPYLMIDCHAVGLAGEKEIYLSANQRSIISAYDHIRGVYTFSKPYDERDERRAYTNYLSLHYAYLSGRVPNRGYLWGVEIKSGEIKGMDVTIFGISDVKFVKNIHVIAREESGPKVLKVGGYGSVGEDLEFLGISFS